VLKAWHRVSGLDGAPLDRSGLLAIARTLGAGRVLDGSVVETAPNEIAIDGALIDVSHLDRRISASTHGAKRDLAALVDTLVAKLVVMGYAGVGDSPAMLAETPFGALQAYVSGQSAFRSGEYLAAVQAFRRALEIDSTFALAALRLDLAAAYTDTRAGAGAIAVAKAHRDKLGAIDRLILDSHPTLGGLEQLAVQDRAVQTAPDVPELWYDLGENFAHWGFSMGFEDAQQRAIAAFDRALALDSLFVPARHHYLLCYSLLGDTAGIRRMLLSLDRRSEQLTGYLWLALGNREDLVTLLTDSPRHRIPPGVAEPAVMLGRLDDMEWAAEYMDSTAVTASDKSYAALFVRWLAVNRGQPDRARRAKQQFASELQRGPIGLFLDPMEFTPGAALIEVLLWDAAPRDAAMAIAAMDSALDRPAPTSAAGLDAWTMQTLAEAEYALTSGRLDVARRALAQLRGAGGSDGSRADDPRAPLRRRLDERARRRARHVALLVDAHLASIEKRSDAASVANIADSVVRRMDPGSEFLDAAGSLLMARVWERLGNLPRAVAATTRIPMTGLSSFYSTYLREHARLSALAGDRDAAIKGYKQYVLLRSKAEPSEQADLDAARGQLKGLLR
jgi:tetratricopeptide (TPR) repeat protein